MKKIAVAETQALNSEDQQLVDQWSSKFNAADGKTALGYLENGKLAAEAKVELEPQMFKRAYQAAGWGVHKVNKYLRFGRSKNLYKASFQPLLPLIKSVWVLNFLAGLPDNEFEDFVAEFTSNPRPIDRNELLSFVRRGAGAIDDTLLDYKIDREVIRNSTPAQKRRIYAKVQEIMRVSDDHEIPAKMKSHSKVLALLTVDEVEPSEDHAAETIDVGATETSEDHAAEPSEVHAAEPSEVHAAETSKVHAAEPSEVHAAEPSEVDAAEPSEADAAEPMRGR